MNKLTSSLKPHLLLRLRNRHFILLDALVLCLTPALALMLRVDGVFALGKNAPALLFYTAAALIIRLVVFYGSGLYSGANLPRKIAAGSDGYFEVGIGYTVGTSTHQVGIDLDNYPAQGMVRGVLIAADGTLSRPEGDSIVTGQGTPPASGARWRFGRTGAGTGTISGYIDYTPDGGTNWVRWHAWTATDADWYLTAYARNPGATTTLTNPSGQGLT